MEIEWPHSINIGGVEVFILPMDEESLNSMMQEVYPENSYYDACFEPNSGVIYYNDELEDFAKDLAIVHELVHAVEVYLFSPGDNGSLPETMIQPIALIVLGMLTQLLEFGYE